MGIMSEAERVYVVDDDADFAAALVRLLRREGYDARPFLDPLLMLDCYADAPAACVLTDMMLGEIDGFQLAEQIRAIDPATAIVFMTGWPTTADAVDAVRRRGGFDYLDKPVDEVRLLAAIAEGVAWSQRRRCLLARLSAMTRRERDVFDLLVRGMSNKAVAAELGISPKTVEDHRAAIMAKTGTTNLAQLIRLAAQE